MLLFDTLLTYLDINQKELNELYNNYFIINNGENDNGENDNIENDNNVLSLPEYFKNFNNIFLDYYYINNNNINSFIYSILYCLDTKFVVDLNQDNYINKFRMEICYDLENKNLFRKFNYVKLRKFKKDMMQKNLLDITNELNECNRQYLADYFGINIYIFVLNNDDDIEYISNILSQNDCDEPNPYKPTLLLLCRENKYYPIIRKNTSLVLKYSENEILNILYEKYVKSDKVIRNNKVNKNNTKKILNNNKNNNNEQVNNKQVNSENKVLKPIKQILLKELHIIAIENKIDIYKQSLKSDKKIYKTKNELYDNLKNMIKS